MNEIYLKNLREELQVLNGLIAKYELTGNALDSENIDIMLLNVKLTIDTMVNEGPYGERA